jgi:hypothetical protein
MPQFFSRSQVGGIRDACPSHLVLFDQIIYFLPDLATLV